MRFGVRVALLLVLAAVADKANACECVASGPPCQNVFEADAVFVGTVQKISEIPGTPQTPYPRQLVLFAVDRTFTGPQTTAVEVVTGIVGGDCGYAFKAGQRYLVYADRPSNGTRLSTSICSRTRPIAEATEDLEFLNRLPSSGTGARVYGAVTHSEHDFVTDQWRMDEPVPFVHLLLRGASAQFDVQTDATGRYEIVGIPPGTYDLQAVPPAAFGSKGLQRAVELRDPRACKVADFSMRYDGRISGTVMTADGQPASGVAVNLMASALTRSTGPTLTERTDKDGHFEFSEVSPGYYVVGISLLRTIEPQVLYPRTFHPGTAIDTSATIVTIAEGTHERLESFRLPAPLQPRELTGSVVWQDGRPVSGAFVSLWDGEGRRQVAAGIRTNADGRFIFTVHDGLSYTVRGSYNIPDDPQHRQVEASVGPFVSSEQLGPLNVVLIRPARQ